MRKDLVIIPEDTPGVLAHLGKALGDAGVNIEAISAFTGGGKGVVHVLVDDDQKALQVLQEAGWNVAAARRVAVAPLPDEPGQLGQACEKLAEAGVNIEQAYIAAGSKLVVVCEEIDEAKQVLGITD
jgi:hypothetical protein